LNFIPLAHISAQRNGVRTTIERALFPSNACVGDNAIHQAEIQRFVRSGISGPAIRMSLLRDGPISAAIGVQGITWVVARTPTSSPDKKLGTRTQSRDLQASRPSHRAVRQRPVHARRCFSPATGIAPDSRSQYVGNGQALLSASSQIGPCADTWP